MSKQTADTVKETSKETSKKSSGKASRRVFLFGRLENEVVLPVIERMLKLNERDGQKPIDLYVNSAGGNGYNADAIIATMHSLSAPVNTICLGHALSGACEILASGTGVRKAYEFATLMFHQTLWEADGDITNLEIQAAQGQKFREAQIELLHRCTKQDKKRLRSDIERDHYLSAPEALKYGIIDKIIVHGSGDAKVKNLRKAAGAAASNGNGVPKAAIASTKGKGKTLVIKRNGSNRK
jgi:ATP-dependent Clp protease protease subunit